MSDEPRDEEKPKPDDEDEKRRVKKESEGIIGKIINGNKVVNNSPARLPSGDGVRG